MIYFVLLLFSLLLARNQYMISKKNIGSSFNGFGVIEKVIQKKTMAPMVYRVLVPWIIRSQDLKRYELCLVTLIFLSLLSIYIVWDTSILLISVILISITLWYDYWDWTIELLGFTLALMSFPVAMLGAGLLSLSRETAPLVGVIYALHTGNYALGFIISVVAVWGLLIVRLVQGQHPLYCQRWMIAINLQLLIKGNISAWFSILLCCLGILGAVQRPEFIVISIIVILGMTMAKLDETRVFVTVIPYAALFLSRYL